MSIEEVKPNNESDKKEYGDDLLLTLHEQFSINQNDTINRFTTIFVALFILFGIYGYAFGITTKQVEHNCLKISVNAFSYLTILVQIVLSFLISLLIYIGYQHRRDQFLNNKIRKRFLPNDFSEIFKGYQGGNKSFLSFIPDSINIKIFLLVVFNIISLITLIYSFYFCNYFNACIVGICIFSAFIVLFPLFIRCMYYMKYISLGKASNECENVDRRKSNCWICRLYRFLTCQ